MKYKVILSYDGTRYSGWQIQPNGIAIQQLLQKSVSTFLRVPTFVTGAGRTDAGVHAKGQVAHFTAEIPIDRFRFLRSINGMLPCDIRVHDVEEVPVDFHACHSAKKKIYHYHICLDRIVIPFRRLYCWHVPFFIDRQLLHRAAEMFIGTHDFTSFANEAHKGTASRGAVRTIDRIDIVDEEGGMRLEFQGNGFLYKMVRNIVGTLLFVASKKLPLDELPRIFSAKDRREAAETAPPEGLFLVKVIY